MATKDGFKTKRDSDHADALLLTTGIICAIGTYALIIAALISALTK